MNIYEKLLNVQMELKAPKGQYNNFGKYKYRSCEDILEALKPVLSNHKLTIFISDEITETNGRNYIKATATLVNIEKPEEKIEVTSLAREEETKKGMDGSQITGSSSSYARKYALNGLFAIDDTKDSDSTNAHGADKKPQKKENKKEATEEERKKAGIEKINDFCHTQERIIARDTMLKEDFENKALTKLTLDELIRLYKVLEVMFKKGE